MAFTPKKSIETVKEELRVLNELSTDEPTTPLWLTPTFWTTAITAVTNIVTVLVLIGWLDSTQAEGVTKALAALVGAAQVIVINSVLVWKYIAGQNQLQAQKITAKYRYMEAVAVEKLRADKA